ncbi:hypothetical protein ACN4EG_01180 [Alkalinema pantanalense CENA528]|uniref:hypothetical protein n=1 Tax=Alkalinema pantanalense TaxID=1620705 RepID=UPI003D6EC771
MKGSLQRFGLVLLLGLVPCRSLAQASSPESPVPPIDPRYPSAVQDAARVDPGENVDSLWAITPDNPKLVWNADKTRLLVVTWKSQAAYDRFIKPSTHTAASEAFVVWVTAAPQVKEFCQNYLKKHPQASIADLNQRLKQYLGLHPDWQYDLFVEMWVSPTDLFRPCVNPSITDRQCALTFDTSNASKPTVKNIADYPAFYKNLYFQSFRSGPGVPWTGLGYTYDWGNVRDQQKAERRDRKNTIGASEFILVPSASYSLQQAASTQRYCEPIVSEMAGKGD